jgi:hypothetical protein
MTAFAARFFPKASVESICRVRDVRFRGFVLRYRLDDVTERALARQVRS